MQMRTIAQGWLVYDITQSAMALTWVTLSFIVPFSLFSLLGGVIADRIGKKHIMIFARLLNAIGTCLLGYITYIGEVTFWHFIYFGFFSGAVGSLAIPASFSIVPEIVPQESLVNANALQTSTYNLSSIIGPILAGALIAVLSGDGTSSTHSVGLVLYIISGLLLLAAMLTIFLEHQGKPLSKPKTSSLEDLLEGLQFVRKEKLLLGLIVMGLVPSAFGKSIHFLLPAFSEDVIGGGPEELGMLTAGMGIGALMGSILLARLGDFKGKGRVMFRITYSWGAAIAIFALTENLIAAAISGAFASFFSSFFGSLNMTVTQMMTPQYIRGRVMSLIMVMSGLTPLAIIPVGAIAEYFSIATALIFTAIMLGLSAWAVHLLFPQLKRIDKSH